MSKEYLDLEGLDYFKQKMDSENVSRFNGRTGNVYPAKGDYTASMVGAVPTTRTVNEKALSSNITLNASDVGALPSSTDLSVYAPKNSPVFTGSISLGRKSGTTVGTGSTAIGYNVEASAKYSHAECNQTVASGNYSHVENSRSIASGQSSHAEGSDVVASGESSHAEGVLSVASGYYSHAEGANTRASDSAAHAEGWHSIASNIASHASGKYNKEMTNDGSSVDQIGDVFVVGNGIDENSRSNALRLAYEGTLYLTKAYKSTGADYAEYFEWLDGNPDNEDRVGRFVTLEDNKIKYAEPGDYVLGVVSGQPCIIGNADEDWLGRWEHDEFNRFIKEYLVHTEVEVTPPSNATEEEILDWYLKSGVKENNGRYFKIETEIVNYPTTSWRHKANPNYDGSQHYIERQDRKEWDAVGMLGVLSVMDDGTCEVNGYAKVSENGVASITYSDDSNSHWRVIRRRSKNVVEIVFR